jgi:hypothetical protein
LNTKKKYNGRNGTVCLLGTVAVVMIVAAGSVPFVCFSELF